MACGLPAAWPGRRCGSSWLTARTATPSQPLLYQVAIAAPHLVAQGRSGELSPVSLFGLPRMADLVGRPHPLSHWIPKPDSRPAAMGVVVFHLRAFCASHHGRNEMAVNEGSRQDLGFQHGNRLERT